jgi:DNA-binding NtrC family response regulator
MDPHTHRLHDCDALSGAMNSDLSLPVPEANLSVLVVEPRPSDLLFVVSAISQAGLRVTAAESFEQAKVLLTTETPSVLITAIRLGEYNGLHLVLRGKTERPDMAAVVTAPSFDTVLLSEADAMNATFVVTPTSQEELVAAVVRTIFASSNAPEPIRAPFERRQHERRAAGALAEVETERRQNRDRRRGLRAPDAVALLG